LSQVAVPEVNHELTNERDTRIPENCCERKRGALGSRLRRLPNGDLSPAIAHARRLRLAFREIPQSGIPVMASTPGSGSIRPPEAPNVLAHLCAVACHAPILPDGRTTPSLCPTLLKKMPCGYPAWT
jgi:hypothetical protein